MRRDVPKPNLASTLVLAYLVTVSLPCAAGPGSETSKNLSSLSLPEYIHQFESSYRDVRSLRADFRQTYVSGERTRVELGTVYFARGGLMRWDYRQPSEKIFLSDGKSLQLYIPDEKQLTRTPVKASEDVRVPFRLLLSRLNLRRVFSRIEFADHAWEHDPADRVLRAFPKPGFEEDYRQVLIEIGPQFDIRRLDVVYPDQSVMEFRFDKLCRNVPLSPSLFKFTPPAGTEIIDQR
jgi:outer membrane lipoprotein carrier protein